MITSSRNKVGKIWLIIQRDFVLITTTLISRNYFETKSFFSFFSQFITTNFSNTDINFWKAWTFLMGVNISNKEYNFFIISEAAVWVFLCTAFLKYTPVILNSLSFLTLKTFIVAFYSEWGRVNEILVFVRWRTLNLPLSLPSPQSWVFCISRTA